MGRMVRKERLPRWGALGLAAACFLLLFCVIGGCLNVPVFLIYGVGTVPTFLMAASATAAAAYICSRAVYSRLRWRLVEHLGSVCLRCDYNLTGNVSGVCPECGRVIARATCLIRRERSQWGRLGAAVIVGVVVLWPAFYFIGGIVMLSLENVVGLPSKVGLVIHLLIAFGLAYAAARIVYPNVA